MRVIVVGLGVQGEKRRQHAGADVAATVDPNVAGADCRSVEDVPAGDFDAALVCVPDEAKVAVVGHLLGLGKHVLVEKPLLAARDGDIDALDALARDAGAVCYTAYNHRFEPHFGRMRELIRSGALGRLYRLRMFYGNGTAGLVRASPWRDRGSGVLADLGSHLLDTVDFWLGDAPGERDDGWSVVSAACHENEAPDHVVLARAGAPAIELEMTLLSWRNDFTADLLAEKGSAHIRSLCKWGPATFAHRTRVLPAGPPPEETETLAQDDPTWALEYAHFQKLCADGAAPDLGRDKRLDGLLRALGRDAIAKAAS